LENNYYKIVAGFGVIVSIIGGMITYCIAMPE
jgi:hypothetical protein